ncbi:RhoGAP-domain-containing protein, partial [Backusella circina FSU 941]
MICQTHQPDHGQQHTHRFSLSLYSNTHINDTIANPKRHTIANNPQELEDFFSKQQNTFVDNNRNMVESEQEEIKLPPPPTIQSTNSEHRTSRLLKSHWETIEAHYINHLSTLQAEIQVCNSQKLQLSKTRDELLQNIIQLQQMTIDLTTKNEQLTRMIAEKENKVSAFMYQQSPPPPVVGVTLVDEPLPPPPPVPAHSSNTVVHPFSSSSSILSSSIAAVDTPKPPVKINAAETPKKELGIFRQLSRRISGRRKPAKDATENIQPSPLSIETISEVIPSKQDDLLHPAVVISTPDETEKPLPQHPSHSKPKLLLKSNSLLRKKKKQAIFGNDIVQQARSENAVVPHIVLKCVREVEFRGLKTEGIYRKSGTHSQMTELKEAFDQNKDPNLSKYDDINVISSLLKLYLREASTCLLSQEFVLDSSLNSKERLNKTYALLHNLPLEAYCTIKFIMQHLKRVHQHQSVNRMPAKNIAVVFGPTLMRFDNEGNEELQMNNMIKTIEYIIDQSHILFADF